MTGDDFPRQVFCRGFWRQGNATMTELCETCKQPLCPWEVQRCEVCLLNERETDEEVKDNRKKANGQTPQAQYQRGDVRGQAPAGGGAVD